MMIAWLSLSKYGIKSLQTSRGYEMGPLNVIHMIGHLRLGAGRNIVDTAKAQKRLFGVDVTILTSEDTDEHWRTEPDLVDELAAQDIRVEIIGDIFHRERSSLIEAATRLASWLKTASEPTMIHAYSAIPAAVARWAGAESVVATCLGWNRDRPEHHNLEDALAYKLCDVVTTPSSLWGDLLVKEFGASDPVVIPIGVDPSRYPALQHQQKQIYSPFRIVTVCELIHRKGVDTLIEAMPVVWENTPDAKLHIIGDGEMADKLKNQARQLDRDGARIIFHGRLDSPYMKLPEYDIFALASRFDSFPVAVIEAMFAGLPVAGTRSGGIAELVGAGKCGELVPPDSPDELGAALVRMIASGRETLENNGGAGQDYARANLTIDRTVMRLNDLYKEISVGRAS